MSEILAVAVAMSDAYNNGFDSSLKTYDNQTTEIESLSLHYYFLPKNMLISELVLNCASCFYVCDLETS